MSSAKSDYLGEAKDLFEKLTSWKEESYEHISTIINSHSNSISTRIGSLVEEVCGLKDEVLDLKKERTVLLETIDLLKSEIRQLSDNLQTSCDPRKGRDYKTFEAEISEEEISKALRQHQESPSIHREQHNPPELVVINLNRSANPKEDEDNSTSDIDDKSNEENDFQISKSMPIQDINMGPKSHNKSTKLDKGGKRKCKLCPYESPDAGNFKRHMTGVHHKIRNYECSQCGHGASQKSTLNLHIRGVHEKIRNHMCSAAMLPHKRAP